MGLSRHRSSYEQQPAYQAAMERIVATTLAAGKKPCCNTYSPEDFAAKKAAGFEVLTFKSDLDLPDGPRYATTGLSQGKYGGFSVVQGP